MAEAIKFGWTGWPTSKFGQGPNDRTTNPIYTSTVVQVTPSQVASVMADIALYNMRVFVNFAGGRNGWTDTNAAGCKIYNPTKYANNVRRYLPTSEGGLLSQADYDALAAQIAAGRVIGYAVDEPNIGEFCGSITAQDVNTMGLVLKEVFPGILVAVRATAPVLNDLPAGGFAGTWSGVDYGWYQLNKAGVVSGQTRRQRYAEERNALLTLNMGMVPAFNWVNGGDGRLWDCQNTGSSSCRISGPQTAISGNQYWLASPDELRETANAIYDDPDAIAFTGFQYTRSGLGSVADFDVYEYRSDFIGAFDDMFTTFATRPRFNGLRVAKGTATPPPPPPAGLSPLVVVATTKGAGDVVTLPAHQAGDLIVVGAHADGATIPGLGSGYASITGTKNVDVAQRVGWRLAVDDATPGGTWNNASGWIASVLRNAHPTTPIGDTFVTQGASAAINFGNVNNTVTNETSKVMGFAVHSAATNVNTPPAGMENVEAQGKSALHITPDGIADWTATEATVNASGNWRAVAFEIVADPAALPDPIAPVIDAITDKTIDEGLTLAFTVNATDEDSTTLAYSLVTPPTGASVGSENGGFQWTPTVGQSSGSPYTVTVRVCDDTSPTPLCTDRAFQVTVNAGGAAAGGVSRIGSNSALGTSVAIPAHQAGDLIVIDAVNTSSGTAVSLPGGYTSILNATPGATTAMRTGYKLAASGAETSGTWTNATSVHVTVYRGVNPAAPIGASIGAQFVGSTSLRYDTLALQITDGSSWVHSAGMHTTATDIETNPPNASTNRTDQGQLATFDTNGGVSSWARATLTLNASGTSRGHVVEIRADPATTGESPVLAAIGNQTVEEQSLLTLTASADDPDTVAENLTYSLDGGNPAWTSITSAGAFIAEPPAGAASGSPYNVTVRVSDGSHEDFETIQITVTAPVTYGDNVRGNGIATPRQRSTMGASSAN
jgi:hypothetical protein